MNEGQPRSYGINRNIECTIDVTSKPKFNLKYKLLWLILWPVYIFEWVAGIGNREELQTKMWNSNLWFYKTMMWHETFYAWDEGV